MVLGVRDGIESKYPSIVFLSIHVFNKLVIHTDRTKNNMFYGCF